ncbi:cytochrome P450 [Conexibacter sp. CPCC 206217]|uniref:cytochrome P450 n=1 Tax=Conexibacter sp. CPCC 206217 TaxID=3064574 RepID=UPI0027291166|nr:cytochrome P450 [Conexibacter sp. CPCC 206217]MDO8212564.1 cytochrome P450 [Conexibacter sp. CPCC 206217]
MTVAPPQPDLRDPEAVVDVLLHGQPLARDDVFELYAAVRREAPLFRSEHGMWVISRFQDVHRALRFAGASTGATSRSDPRYATSPTLQTFAESMLHFDEPADHARQRRLVRQAFTQQTVQGLRPFVEGLVGQLLDECAERGEFDAIADYADRIPVAVICHMLGVPAADVEVFHEWNFAITSTSAASVPPERMAAADAAMLKLRAYITDLLDARRSTPSDDLLSKLITARDEDDQLSDSETIALAVLLLAAGSDTTTAFLGAALAALYEHPDQLALLRAEPARIRGSVEELMRYAAPVHFGITRLTRAPLQLGGVEIPAGERLWTLLAGANRDPDEFERPEQLDLTREHVRHLGFAQGMHMCLGAMLARMETGTALEGLLLRFPRLQLRESSTPWYDHGNLRGVRRLAVAG